MKTRKSAATRRAYRSDLKEWMRLLETSNLLDTDPSFILKAVESTSFDDLSASTQSRRIATLKSFRKWASNHSGRFIAPLNFPTTKGRHISGLVESTSLTLTKDQCRMLLKAALTQSGHDAIRNHALIYFMLTVPMRRAAIARMEVEHVITGKTVAYVRCIQTRGDLSLRYLLPSKTVELIEEHKEHYGIASGPLWRSHSRRNPGGRLTPTSIYRIVRNTAVAAGLPEIGAHTLRHTGCTLAIDNGASLQQVQTHARHKQIETTMVYVHQRDRLRDSAADFIKLDEESDS